MVFAQSSETVQAFTYMLNALPIGAPVPSSPGTKKSLYQRAELVNVRPRMEDDFFLTASG